MATWCFFDCAGVRLFLEKSRSQPFVPNGSVLYFRTPDITVTVRELEAKGVSFIDKPHLIAPTEDHDLWMTFFKHPEGNTLALMQEPPKGYKPPSNWNIHRRDTEFTEIGVFLTKNSLLAPSAPQW